MKLVKLSLAAAMLMGASAFAVENVKVEGNVQVLYATDDKDLGDGSGFFEKQNSYADAGLHLKVSADLFANDMFTINSGASYTALSTLGLENNLVSNVWGSSHTAKAGTGQTFGGALGGVKVENSAWFNEAWGAVSVGKSILKVGRMELDTPLAFTETWSIDSNSFEAAVLINQDIPDTTVIAAWVGNGNGTETFGDSTMHSNVAALGHAYTTIVNADGKFSTYGTDGAYAAAIINNSLEMLTVQAWYYDVVRVAQAYWLQGDVNFEGASLGLQYTGLNVDTIKVVQGTRVETDSNAFAVQLGYEMPDFMKVSASFSTVSDEHGTGFNTATAAGTAQTKLYTEAWWNYGYVTQADNTAFHLAGTLMLDMVDLSLFYTMVDTDTKTTISGVPVERDMQELTLAADKSFGPLDVSLVYIMTDANDQNYNVTTTATSTTVESSEYHSVQAYLTLNF